MRRSIPLLSGIALLAAAAILAFVIVPGQAKWPDDVDQVRIYEGALETLLDTEALAAGDLGGLFLTDVPITLERHVRTVDVDGNRALVTEDARVLGPDGQVIGDRSIQFAIDRGTMLNDPDGFPGGSVPDREPGLVVGWPIGTEQRDYTGWSDEIGRTVPLTFEREEEHAGTNTYVFANSISSTRVADPAVLASIPATLPKNLVVSLAGSLDLPEALAEQFQQLLPALPDDVPLGLLYRGETTYWVEPTSGVVVDVERTESRSVFLDVPQIPIPVPVANVWAWSYAQTDASVAEAIDDAESAADQLRLLGTWVPLGLAILGVGGIAFGLVRRRPDRFSGGDDLTIPGERVEHELLSRT